MGNTLSVFLNKLLHRGCAMWWGGLWLTGLLTTAWYVLHVSFGDRWVLVRVPGYFMPWLFMGLLVATLATAVARRSGLVVILLLPTMVFGWIYAPLLLPHQLPKPEYGLPLKVMSYNVLIDNSDVVGVARVIRAAAPDILLLQEMGSKTLAGLMTEFSTDPQPWYYAYEPDVLQATMSRYPLTPLPLAETSARAQRSVVQTPAGSISVWNVHPNTPMSWQKQYQQVAKLSADIAVAQGPLIVGGDFNATDQSETYRLVSKRLHNAHWEAATGFGFSFPGNKPTMYGVPVLTPVVRVDHIFYNDFFVVTQAQTLGDSGGSDHLPVVATLVLMPPPGKLLP